MQVGVFIPIGDNGDLKGATVRARKKPSWRRSDGALCLGRLPEGL